MPTINQISAHQQRNMRTGCTEGTFHWLKWPFGAMEGGQASPASVFHTGTALGMQAGGNPSPAARIPVARMCNPEWQLRRRSATLHMVLATAIEGDSCEGAAHGECPAEVKEAPATPQGNYKEHQRRHPNNTNQWRWVISLWSKLGGSGGVCTASRRRPCTCVGPVRVGCACRDIPNYGHYDHFLM